MGVHPWNTQPLGLAWQGTSLGRSQCEIPTRTPRDRSTQPKASKSDDPLAHARLLASFSDGNPSVSSNDCARCKGRSTHRGGTRSARWRSTAPARAARAAPRRNTTRWAARRGRSCGGHYRSPGARDGEPQKAEQHGVRRVVWMVLEGERRGPVACCADVSGGMCFRDSAGWSRSDRWPSPAGARDCGPARGAGADPGACARSGRTSLGAGPVILMCMCLILIACTVYDAGDEGSLRDAMLEQAERTGRSRP